MKPSNQWIRFAGLSTLALLIALPFMADVLQANFLRIAAHITNG